MALRWLVAGLAVATVASGAAAQPPLRAAPGSLAVPAPASSPVNGAALPGVTVVAPRIEQVPELIQKFGVPDGRGRLARWDQPVCPAVGGLPDDMDRLIEQRIRDTAKAASIEVDRARCPANIIVLISPTPRELTERIVHHHSAVLGSDPRWPLDRFRAQAMIASDDPVRLWYTSLAVQSAGNKAFEDLDSRDGPLGYPTLYQVQASRLSPPTEEAFNRIVVVVDANRIVGFNLEQISAYVAMVSLAQANPKADLEGVSSILSMFADRARGATPQNDLTFWDRAYLTGLYDTGAQVNFTMQRSHIAEHIQRDVARHEVLALATTKSTPASPPN